MKLSLLTILCFLTSINLFGQRYLPCDYDSPVLCNLNGDSLKTEFDSFYSFWEDTTLLVTIKNGRVGLINSMSLEEIMPCNFSSIFICPDLDKTVLLVNDSAHQFYNFRDKKNLSPIFLTDKESFQYTDGQVCFIGPEEVFIARQNYKFGMMKINGEVILEFKYDKIHSLQPHETIFHVAKEKKEFSIISKTGKVIKKIKLDEVIGFWDAKYLLAKSKGKTVFINEMGNILNEPKESKLRFSIIRENGLENLFSRNGKQINKLPAEYITNADNSGLFILYNGNVSVIDSNGIVLFKNLYNAELHWTTKGYQIIVVQRQADSTLVYGLYERNKNEILAMNHSKISFSHPVFTMTKNNKEGIYVPESNLMIPPKYEELYYNSKDEPLCAKLNGKWALIDFTEKPITDSLYDKMDRIFGGKCEVELNGEKFKIDKTGSKVK